MNLPRPQLSPLPSALALALAAGLALLAGLAASPALAAPPVAGERDVKTAYLYNLTRFVDWPARAKPATAFRMVVVGDPLIAEALQRAVGAGQLRALPVRVVACPFSERPPECDLLYVAATSRGQLERLHANLGREPTLTIGEGAEFLASGGAIAFRLEQQTIRLSICPENATDRGLSISSKLLRLCKLVGRGR